ncbi:MAG: tetratricopeptide repeat protein [Spirochaetota bacterium]
MDNSFSPQDRFAKALEYEKAGDFMLALQEYATLSWTEIPYRPALVNLGSLYSRMNRIDDAMNCYQKAVELEDDNLSWFNIGSIHYRKG